MRAFVKLKGYAILLKGYVNSILPRIRQSIFLSVCLLIISPLSAEEVERITVGATPIGSDSLSVQDFPGYVQSVDSQQIENAASPDIADYLNRHFSGVHINSAQGNPLQADVYYRGFAASPLLGLPMGLTIYQNGMRLNEPLGDTVNWDLIPTNAIANMSLIGGANALYGLNTLGGSIVLEMKDGFNYQGNVLEVEHGSHHRFIGNFESGGNNGNWAYYVNAQRFYEEGWRDLSQSWAENLYGSVDWRGEQGSFGINYHRAMSDLTGNGLSPAVLLDIDRDAIFTAPDITDHDMYSWIFNGDYHLNEKTLLSGNFYFRDNTTGSFNGDEADDDDDDGGGGGGADDDEECPEGSGVECNAINNISVRDQEALGGTLQIEFPLDWFQLQHNVNVGIGYREGKSRFESQVQNALLNDERTTQGPGSATGDFEDDEETKVSARVESVYIYFGDTINISDDWTGTVSAYFHDSSVRLRDRTGEQSELDGKHDYDHLNWAVGAVRHWSPTLDLYANYSESSRLPTPIELACSEEILDLTDEDECRLPNAFVADPPLDEVIAKSIELGARGITANNWNWTVGAFHTQNDDDIIFQTTGRSRGLFRNIDETRRIGVEVSIAGSYGRMDWSANYTYVEATFEDDFMALSPNHENANDDGEIEVEEGDTIPGIPENLFKVAADYAFTDRLSAGLDMIAVSDSYLRGDESNELGKVSGYAVFNARARYKFNNWFEAYLTAENIFDKDYENFGLVAEEPYEVLGLDEPDNEEDEDLRFFAPGAPSAVWVGLKAKF